MPARWRSGLAAAILVGLCAGCGERQAGTGVPSPPATTTPAPEQPGAPGAPGNRDQNNRAPGSPIKIPAVTERGVSMTEVRPRIKQRFIQACGDGTVCVTLVERPGDPDPEITQCEFSHLNKPAGELVPRYSEVVIVTGLQPCDTPASPPTQAPPTEQPYTEEPQTEEPQTDEPQTDEPAEEPAEPGEPEPDETE